MKAFITGSHAYGTPTKDSDTDLVVLVSKYTSNLLVANADSIPIRYGNLNIIQCTREDVFLLWEECTEHLHQIKPVTRGYAIQYIQEQFGKAGLERFLKEVSAHNENSLPLPPESITMNDPYLNCRAYRKNAAQQMRPWTPEEDMRLVSVSDVDKINGSPTKGDMIAIGNDNPNDRWLVSAEFFETNYDPKPAP